MSDSPVFDARKIRRLSLLLAWSCLLLTLTIPLLIAGYWWWSDSTVLLVRIGVPVGAVKAGLGLLPWQRAAGALVSGLPAGLLLAGLMQARRCFLRFAAGEYFSARIVDGLRRFAALACGSGAAGLLVQPMLSVLLTAYYPIGQRQLTVGIGTDALFTFLIGGMVWLIARVMGGAVALAEENAQFV